MADKITLDFETGMITWDTDSLRGEEYCPDLKERKPQILAAMGYEPVDFSPVIESFNAFANKNITEKELLDRLAKFEKE